MRSTWINGIVYNYGYDDSQVIATAKHKAKEENKDCVIISGGRVDDMRVDWISNRYIVTPKGKVYRHDDAAKRNVKRIDLEWLIARNN